LHFEVLPKTLLSYSVQQQLLAYVTLLRQGGTLAEIGTGYFIAFPCMHIATPVIALWFLRRWRRVATTLLGLNILLCAAIVLLEYHYVVDLIGGVAVAALAIVMVDRRE
jgi:membrane-associated phospholipid phosphatase